MSGTTAEPMTRLRGGTSERGATKTPSDVTERASDIGPDRSDDGVEAPFVHGTAEIVVGPDGRPQLRLRASLGPSTAPFGEIWVERDAWSADQELPLPEVRPTDDGWLVRAPDEARLRFDRSTSQDESGAFRVQRAADVGDTSVGDATRHVSQDAAMAEVRARLSAIRSGGEPLAGGLVTMLEQMVARALPRAIIHDGQDGADLTQAFEADAVAVDSHLLLAENAFRPEVAAGLELILRGLIAVDEGQQGPVEPSASDPTAAETGAPVAAAEGLPTSAGGETVPIDQAARGETDVAAGTAGGAEAATGTVEGVVPAERLPAGAEGEAKANAVPADDTDEPELLMPPAPTEPSEAQAARTAAATGRAARAARSAANLPSAADTTSEARGAVTEPDAETAARAEHDLAEELAERPAPSSAILELCDRIRAAIRAKRPADEDDLLGADLREPAEEVGADLQGSVESDAGRIESSYDEMNEPGPGSPDLSPTAIEEPSRAVPNPGIDASGAAPDLIPPEDLSLDNDVEAVQAKVEESRVNRRSSEPIVDDPFSSVRSGTDELGQMAAADPARVAQEQAEAIADATANLADLQAQALATLRSARSSTVSGVGAGQEGMVESEEMTREQVSTRASQIFTTAQEEVRNLLSPLQSTAMSLWRTGLDPLTTRFEDHLDRVQRWVDDRHSGVGGKLLGAWDALTGLPGWVTDEYDDAEKAFTDSLCDLLLDISTQVNGIIAAAEAKIAAARREITELFDSLPTELQDWAAQEQARFDGQLDALSGEVSETQAGFEREIAGQAVDAVLDVQQRVEALREAAKGLIGQIIGAVNAFLDDPARAIINGLLTVVGIPPPAFWALVDKIAQVIDDIADDPENFINNLVAAVKLGFQNFFDNFGDHVIDGFWTWLFSGLGSVGVEIPTDSSLASLVKFALELMGLTWPNIREILVRHVGEDNVELIEQAWGLLMTSIQEGMDGVLRLVAERLDPATILQTILDAAISFLTETLIQQVIVRVIGFLNPVGAVLQAIELIYKVLEWIFENAEPLFRFVEAIVNGMANIIAGDISGTAGIVEQALASMIPIVIDFLAGLMNLDDLPDEIADVIRDLQTMVLKAVDAAIEFIVTQARALLESLGIGGDEAAEDGEGGAQDTELGKEVAFTEDGERHRQWVTQGEGAKLMVASTPTPVTAKLAEWRGRLGDHFFESDEGARAAAAQALDEAETLAGGANNQAAELGLAFVEAERRARAEGDPTPDPPDDGALEAMQTRLTGLLRTLFDAFGERPDLRLLFESQLGRVHGSAVGEVDRAIDALLEKEPNAATTLSGWDEVKTALGETAPLGSSIAKPTHASPTGFSRQATEWAEQGLREATRKTPYPHNSKHNTQRYLVSQKQYLKDTGSLPALKPAYEALIEGLWTGRSPVSTIASAFRAKFATESLPDETLVEAVQDRGGVVQFMQAVSDAGGAGTITWAEFESNLWGPVGANSPAHRANRKYLKARFRAVNPGNHEWIPTNMIGEVVERSTTAGGAATWNEWVTMHTAMRTDTGWIIFKPSVATYAATPLAGPAQTALVGHPGALNYESSPGRVTPLQSDPNHFHEQLREAFRAGTTPRAVVEEMETIASGLIWRGIDRNVQFAGPYFLQRTLAGQQAWLAAPPQGQAGVALAPRQAQQWEALQTQFQQWKNLMFEEKAD